MLRGGSPDDPSAHPVQPGCSGWPGSALCHAVGAIEQRKLTGQAALDRKIRLYDEFVRSLVAMMGLGDQPAIKEDELTNRMAEMTPEMLIYASNGFLKQWRKFRSVSVDETNPAQAIFQMEELLKSMRKDLGHSSWLLDKGDVLAVFINDIDDVVK